MKKTLSDKIVLEKMLYTDDVIEFLQELKKDIMYNCSEKRRIIEGAKACSIIDFKAGDKLLK